MCMRRIKKKQEEDKFNQTAFYSFVNRIANDICDKLIQKQWLRYKDSSVVPHVGGIYVIGVKRSSKRAIIYL